LHEHVAAAYRRNLRYARIFTTYEGDHLVFLAVELHVVPSPASKGLWLQAFENLTTFSLDSPTSLFPITNSTRIANRLWESFKGVVVKVVLLELSS